MSELFWVEHRKCAKLMEPGVTVTNGTTKFKFKDVCIAEVVRVRTHEGTTEWKSVIYRHKGMTRLLSQTFRKKQDAMAITVVSVKLEDYHGYQ